MIRDYITAEAIVSAIGVALIVAAFVVFVLVVDHDVDAYMTCREVIARGFDSAEACS